MELSKNPNEMDQERIKLLVKTKLREKEIRYGVKSIHQDRMSWNEFILVVDTETANNGLRDHL